MSEHGKGQVDCPFSGHDETLVNVKFFRGFRNDVITAAEFNEQARSAAMQRKLGTARVSREAPASPHQVINVKEFVANL